MIASDINQRRGVASSEDSRTDISKPRRKYIEPKSDHWVSVGPPSAQIQFLSHSSPIVRRADENAAELLFSMCVVGRATTIRLPLSRSDCAAHCDVICVCVCVCVWRWTACSGHAEWPVQTVNHAMITVSHLTTDHRSRSLDESLTFNRCQNIS